MMAWIDLLLLANHKDGGFMVRGIWVPVLRGQLGYSVESLAKRWQWSRGKTERWLKILENGQQIVRQKSRITTTITIVNYSKYQSNGKTNGATSSTTDGTTDGKQTIRVNKVNKGSQPFAVATAAPLRKITP